MLTYGESKSTTSHVLFSMSTMSASNFVYEQYEYDIKIIMNEYYEYDSNILIVLNT